MADKYSKCSISQCWYTQEHVTEMSRVPIRPAGLKAGADRPWWECGGRAEPRWQLPPGLDTCVLCPAELRPELRPELYVREVHDFSRFLSKTVVHSTVTSRKELRSSLTSTERMWWISVASLGPQGKRPTNLIMERNTWMCEGCLHGGSRFLKWNIDAINLHTHTGVQESLCENMRQNRRGRESLGDLPDN